MEVTGPSPTLDGSTAAVPVGAPQLSVVPTVRRLPGRPRLHRLGGQVRGRVVPGSVTAALIGVVAAAVAYAAVLAHGLGDLWTAGSVAAGLVAAGAVGAATHRAVARIGLPGTGRLIVVVVVSLVPVLLDPGLADLLILVGAAATTAGLAHWATSTRTYTGGESAVFVGLPAALAAATGVSGLLVPALAAVAAIIGGLLLRRRPGRTLATVAGAVVPAGVAVAAVGPAWSTHPAQTWPVWVIAGAAGAAVVGVRARRMRRP
jgi:hypothetical protein